MVVADDAAADGRHLCIAPEGPVSFCRPPNGDKVEAVIQICNKQMVPTSFNMKITRPAVFLVRPRRGVLDPGATEVVRITTSGCYEPASSGKPDALQVVSSAPCDVDNGKRSQLQYRLLLVP